MKLRTGESLMFAPSAAIDLEAEDIEEGEDPGSAGGLVVKRLGHEALKIRVRKRITEDGGRSVMAM